MSGKQATISLDDRYTVDHGTVFLTGVQALVRLPMDQHRADKSAGLRTGTLISGYPGSPLAGYDMELSRRAAMLADHDVVLRPALNEELGASAVYGSQIVGTNADARFDGVVGIWYGKAPGVDRASDAMKHGNVVGVSRTGGVLALCGDDVVSKSSTVPSAIETALFDIAMPTLTPGDVQEVLDLGLHGISLSRASGLWVGMKVPTSIADGSGTVTVDPARVCPSIPVPEVDGSQVEHQVDPLAFATPRVLDLESTMNGTRLEMARRYAASNGLNQIVDSRQGDDLGLIASGKTFIDLQEALRRLGVEPVSSGVRLLKIGMPFPLEPRIVREFAQGLSEIVVVEEKRSFLELLVKDVLPSGTRSPQVLGKFDQQGQPLVPSDRELDPDVIARVLAGKLRRADQISGLSPPTGDPASTSRLEQLAPLPTRTPYFCSGCPHNSSTKVPDGSIVGGGIGCHGMVAFMPAEQVGSVIGLTQMGGEGAQWIGMAPFVETPHIFQNLGDGTFQHSGSLAIRAAVAAGVNITYKLLANAAVAMTGGQAPVGAMAIPELVESLLAEGVSKVVVTTEEVERYRGIRLAGGTKVVDRRELVNVQSQLEAIPGVTVLIHDQECAAEKRRKRKRGLLPKPQEAVFINERVCEGCGDCGQKSNCLSVRPIDTEFGRKTQIHQSSCNRDFTCLEGDCPSFLTVVPNKKAPSRPAAEELDAEPMPSPSPVVPDDRFAIRVTGVGGSGVVTVAQILGFAAMMEGRFVRGLDQTGLAQKGGPVVSDLQWSTDPLAMPGKLSAGACDLYLGCDLLVAADARQLAAADPSRTVAVVSCSEVPTGPMIADTSIHFPPAERILRRITSRTRRDPSLQLNSHHISETLFGSDQSANLLLLGAAYQAGTVPLSADSIESAIRLNGAAVETNIQAFRRGRQFVCASEDLSSTLETLSGKQTGEPELELTPEAEDLVGMVGVPLHGELSRLLRIRVPDLIEYQNERYAREYVEFIRRVVAAEHKVSGETQVSEAVAIGLYKLMAYKDEYEVARLHLDPAMRQSITAQFGEGAQVKLRLHPPFLRAIGLKRKLELGRWITPFLVALRAGRRLRGTPVDLFGHTRIRRLERQLIRDYRDAVARVVRRWTQANNDIVLQLAELPDLVRGYEGIKTDTAEQFYRELSQLQARLDEPQVRVTHRVAS